MLQKFRSSIANTVMLAFEVVGSLASGSGAVVAIFFGKLFAAAALAALSLGIFLRFASRRRPPQTEPHPTPPWVQFTCALISLVEVAALTEATNLPVRLTQPDFEKINWVLVLLALLTMYYIQVRFFRSVLTKRNANTPSVDP